MKLNKLFQEIRYGPPGNQILNSHWLADPYVEKNNPSAKTKTNILFTNTTMNKITFLTGRLSKALAVIMTLALSTSSVLAADVLIYSNEVLEENSNDMILDFDDTGGDVTIQFGNTLGEQLLWDNTAGQFVFTDDLAIEGNTFTLDSDNTGAGANVEIVAEQGSDNDGTLRYNATTNRWEISNDGGAFSALQTAGSTDADTLDSLDSTQFLRSDTSDSFTSGTLTFNAGTTLDVDGTADFSGATDIILPNTESNTFILDNDDTGGDVVLQFGNTLNETLTWDNANSRFNLSDDINIEGNITLTGTVDGVDVAVLDTTVTGHLDGGASKHDATEVDFEKADGNKKVVQAGSDNVETALNDIDEAIGNQTYTNDNVVTDNQTATASIDAIDTAIGDRAYTNDNVVTDGESITASIDALDSALGNSTKTMAITMNDLTVVEDGSNNRANIYNGNDTANSHQYYTVKSRQAALNDLDVKVKVLIPQDFVNFTGNAGDLSFYYKNTGVNNTDSKIDILVEDDDGDDAFTAADGQNLFNTGWTEYTDEFDGAGFDPSAGEYIYITLRGYASRAAGTYQQPYMGEIVLKYTGSND